MKVLPQQLVIWLCSYGVHEKSDLTMGATPTNVAPDLNSGREQVRRPQRYVNAVSLVNVSRADMSGERGVGGPVEPLEWGRRPVNSGGSITTRSRMRDSGYRRRHADTEPSGTVETSARRGITHRVTDGIRRPPKSGGMRARGVGGGHSSDDGSGQQNRPGAKAPYFCQGF